MADEGSSSRRVKQAAVVEETGKPLCVGVPKEIHPGERRVAATPTTVKKMRQLGLDVIVQAGAGEQASFLDAAYAEVGARIVQTAAEVFQEADIVVKVRAPEHHKDFDVHEADLLKEKATLISFVWPAQNGPLLERLKARKATVFGVDCVPRITRAQKLDALSATANLVGYKAVIEGASHFGRFLGGQMTAAGRVKPANVLVVGAGVAGLAAIAAARSLGAVVRAFDTRPVVREQVESLGGKFVEFKFEGETGEGTGGYAKEVSEAYLAAEQALIAQHCAEVDIVITTALIPGKPAPKLVTSGAVVGMNRGSVIVDLAAEQGGNCALTEPDRVVSKYGVTIVGLTDLASRMAPLASDLYAATVVTFLTDIVKDGKLAIHEHDEIHRGMLVLREGEMRWPPPVLEVRAGQPRPQQEAKKDGEHHGKHHAKPPNPWAMRIATLLAVAILVPLGIWGSPDLLQRMTVFLLACIVGWHVIWNVTHSLHTPLMSVTNAISGIILIGGLLLIPGAMSGITLVLAAVAVLIAAINVAGGFLVTQRMLRMFHK
ncbi:MAG: Re/Si-specific NAD(P)(+) transhydrogenase subunit alpha [Deltaproteobacteria bacterium]|nr:Re/Si-specific NAD(P)(+) transhydrogenase subunit alpha [Deltaproteobacteria bacterium]